MLLYFKFRRIVQFSDGFLAGVSVMYLRANELFSLCGLFIIFTGSSLSEN